MTPADLHCHSYYSDGLQSPTEVARLAARAGVQVIALTDHDTTAGVAEMTAACRALGLVNLPAVEISAFTDCDVHILGYNIDCKNRDLQSFLSDLERARTVRMGKILEKLAAHGMPLDMADVRRLAMGSVSRGHVARAMIAAGYETDLQDCFRKWINYNGKCYVPNDRVPPEEAIAAVHAAGGKAVLAHPCRLRMPDEDKAQFIARLAAAGLDGVEAVYKQSSPERVALFRGMAEENGLFVTTGNDFHSADRQTIVPRPLDEKTERNLFVS